MLCPQSFCFHSHPAQTPRVCFIQLLIFSWFSLEFMIYLPSLGLFLHLWSEGAMAPDSSTGISKSWGLAFWSLGLWDTASLG